VDSNVVERSSTDCKETVFESNRIIAFLYKKCLALLVHTKKAMHRFVGACSVST